MRINYNVVMDTEVIKLKGASLFSKLSLKLENNKRIKWIIYTLLVVAALAIFISSIGSSVRVRGQPDATSKPSDSNELQAYTERLESRLESILAGMSGVGRVRVMITFDGTEESILASDEQSSESESGTSKSKRPSMLSTASGEEAIVLKELLPKVCGVVVVAEGARNVSVNMDIVSAVSTVLGIKQSNVQVFEMNENIDWN